MPAADDANDPALHPRDLADRLQCLDPNELLDALRRLPDDRAAEVIAELPRLTQVRLFESLRPVRLSGIISEMRSDEAADVLGSLSAARLDEIMAGLSKEDADALNDLLRHPKDSAGGIMRTDFLSVRDSMTLGEAREAVRTARRDGDAGIFYIYATDAGGRLTGVLRIHDLIFGDLAAPVSSVMGREVRFVSIHADQEHIAQLFNNYHYLAMPVVDDFGKLRGLVTSDSVLQVVQQEATEDIQRMAGLSGEERIDTPWPRVTRNRLVWLLINLGTAFLAAWVVSLFEETISTYAILAVFLPIVAGQGGNAGTQTLTIVVRAMALGEIRMDARTRVLFKELGVALLTGTATGLVVGLIAWLWQGNAVLGGVLCVALVVNMLAAAASGVAVPLALRALKIDPALASAIMVTTVTDVVGFFAFLGLATVALTLIPGVFA